MSDRNVSIELQAIIKASAQYAKAEGRTLSDAVAFAETMWDFLSERVGERGGSGQVPGVGPEAAPPVTDTPSWSCPEDMAPMKLRTAKDGSQFYGCSNFPNCRGTRRIDGSTGGFPKAQARSRS